MLPIVFLKKKQVRTKRCPPLKKKKDDLGIFNILLIFNWSYSFF